MNYQRIYEQLTAKDMIADYTEKHHIIPKCMGGTNDPSNLVSLTPEAHYVAHQLLVKIYPTNHKLIYATVLMTAGKFRNNKLYGWVRRKNSVAMRAANRVVSDETKAKMSASATGKIKGPQTDEHRLAISMAGKGVLKSKSHSTNIAKATLGNISINKDGAEKKVKQDMLDTWLADGWQVGGRKRTRS